MKIHLYGLPIRCQHFLGKFHHLQGHVTYWLCMTLNLFVKSSRDTVGIAYCLNLEQINERIEME